MLTSWMIVKYEDLQLLRQIIDDYDLCDSDDYKICGKEGKTTDQVEMVYKGENIYRKGTPYYVVIFRQSGVAEFVNTMFRMLKGTEELKPGSVRYIHPNLIFCS